MNFLMHRLREFVRRRSLGHVVSILTIIVALLSDIELVLSFGRQVSFLVFIPAVVIVALLESFRTTVIASLVMVLGGLALSASADGALRADSVARAALFCVASLSIAVTFRRQKVLQHELHGALALAQSRLEAVELSELHYRQAFEGAAIGFANLDSNGNLINSNARLSEMTGYEANELFGRFFPVICHPDSRRNCVRALRQLISADRPSFSSELKLTRKDQSVFWARVTLSPSPSDGEQSSRIFAIVEDVNDRREAREALRIEKEWLELALSSGRLGTWQIDIEMRTISGSPTFWKLLGLPKAASYRIDDLASVVHLADWERFALAAEQRVEENYDVAIRVKQPDNSSRWIALRGRSEFRQERPYRIGVAADLSDRREVALVRKAAAKRDLIVSELRHRLSNVFPVVAALVNMIEAEHGDVREYKESLIDRLRALEEAHNLLSTDSAGAAMLKDLVLQELRPYRDTRQVTVDGPAIPLTSGAAESFAMIVHELTTNSVKHGALGRPGGQLDVKWFHAPSPASPGDVVFAWVETGKGDNKNSARRGFGYRIIGADGPPLIGRDAKLEILDEGLRYSLHLPRNVLRANPRLS
jgi:PAS domain S-box-containing protein